MNNVEFLKEIRKWIEKGWTQRAYAKTAGQIHCLPTDRNAACFCLYGAAMKAQDVGGASRLSSLLLSHGISHIPAWNDDPKRTKDEVIKVLNQAIEKQEQWI